VLNFENIAQVNSVKFGDVQEIVNNNRITILDVRQNLERQKSHIAESIHIPFYEVQNRMSEVPLTSEIWVHCESGYRAATVLGAIESSGRTAVLIDDDFAEAAHVSALEVIEGKWN